MVSVSVSSLEQRPEKSKTGSGESALWYPELPDPTLQIMPVQNERVSRMIGHMPYSMCLFGGIDGGLLPYLTEIVVWVVDRCDFGIYADKYHIWALEFHYSSQRDSLEPIVFGRIPDVDPDTYERRRYQISIDSPNGERINSVDTMFQDSRFPFAMTVSVPVLSSNLVACAHLASSIQVTGGAYRSRRTSAQLYQRMTFSPRRYNQPMERLLGSLEYW